MRPPQAFVLVPLLLLCGLGACSDASDDGAGGGCGPIRRESLDSAYLVHVLGEDGDFEYTSNPPTSGPHQPTPPVGGAVDEPIPAPVQIGLLEQGDVLLQYLPSIPTDDLTELRALAGDRVTVAPNPDLDDPVVATAWVYKRSCASVDAGALQEFMDERIGKGPDS